MSIKVQLAFVLFVAFLAFAFAFAAFGGDGLVALFDQGITVAGECVVATSCTGT